MHDNHLNLAVIGHSLHGKSTLTAALSNRLAIRFGGIDPIHDKDKLSRPFTANHHPSSDLRPIQTFTTPFRQIDCLDCPGYGRQAEIGFHTADLAVLVVDVGRGIEARTIEHALLARHVGVPHLVVVLNLPEGGNATPPENCEILVRKLLHLVGYPGDDVPFFHANLLRTLGEPEQQPRWLDELIGLLETVSRRGRTSDAPLVFHVWKEPIGGCEFVGWVARGTVRVGDEVEVAGGSVLTTHALVKEIGVGKAAHTELAAGTLVTVALQSLSRITSFGTILYEPGTLESCRSFALDLTLPDLVRLGHFRHGPTLYLNRDLEISFGTTRVTGRVDPGTREGVLRSGNRVLATVRLSNPVPLAVGFPMIIRQKRTVLGVGSIAGLAP